MLALVSYLLILVSFVFCCLDAPKITHISTPHILSRPEMLTLNCTADGNPEPNITWTRLSNGETVNMPLTVTGKKYEEVYRCTASNEIGTVFNDTSVTRMYHVIEWYLFACPQALCQMKPKQRLEIGTSETRAVTISAGIYIFLKGVLAFTGEL